MWFLALIVLLPLAGWTYQRLGERRDARRYPPPGRLLDGIHIYQTGAGGPTVVLEAGISASSLSWRRVQEALSGETTVVSYDRRGYGWSARATAPRTLPNLVDDLHTLLESSGLPGPFIFVGHSFGGLLLRHFAARYPAAVRALVLVDPLEPIEWNHITAEQAYRLGKGVMLSRRGAWLARLGVVRLGLELLMSGSLVIPKLLAKVSSGKGSSVTDRLVGEVRKMPAEVWPMVRAHWCLPRSFLTMAEYLERLPEACSSEPPPVEVPMVVISASSSDPGVIEAHRRTAAGGTHLVAENSGHWVQLDRPDVVIEAVRRVIVE